MSRIARPDEQVRLLTNGLDLPLPPLEERPMRAIANGISIAWRSLLESIGPKLLECDEPEINSFMCSRLNILITEDRKWGQLVQKATRGEETVNYDGTATEMRPDISLKLTNRSPNFPLVMECKLVGVARKKDVGLYCKHGIMKFVDGGYAWAAREGVMIAYVLDGSTIDGCLRPHLEKSLAQTPDPLATQELPVPRMFATLEASRSLHGRAFIYRGRASGPGPIALWHFWLRPERV